jgi:hypothetical protein
MNMNHLNVRSKRPLPTRQEQLASLEKEEFDVLVIGGGATGSGTALDSVTRGILLLSPFQELSLYTIFIFHCRP